MSLQYSGKHAMEFLEIPRHGGALTSLLHMFKCISSSMLLCRKKYSCLLLSSVAVYFNASSVGYLSDQDPMFMQKQSRRIEIEHLF
jgi:hypothetical protein